MRALRVLLILLVVPIAAYAAAIHTEGEIAPAWERAVLKRYGGTSPEPAEVCQDRFAGSQVRMVCSDMFTLRLLKRVAIASGAVGLTLAVLPLLLRPTIRRNRRLGLRLFRPLFQATRGLLLLLLISHAILLAGIVGYLLDFLPEWVRNTAIVFLMSYAFTMTGVSLSLFRQRQGWVDWRELTPEDNPELAAMVGDLARSVGDLRIHQILVSIEYTFAVSAVPMLQGAPPCHTLYLPLPYCRLLTREELRAVIGHELGHLQNRDGYLIYAFYSHYEQAVTTLNRLRARVRSRLLGALLFPFFPVLTHFLEAAGRDEVALWHERELAADRMGAELASPHAMASALIKLTASEPLLAQVWQEMVQGLRHQPPRPNAGLAFAALVQERGQTKPGIPEEGEEEALPNLHPHLTKRLQALSMESLLTESLSGLPEDAAIHLIPQAERLEEELTAALYDRWRGTKPVSEVHPA